jgi:hypothetical protein
MCKIHKTLINIFLLLFLVACSEEVIIEKVPAIVNKYDSRKPVSVDGIIPTRGIIDQTFIVNGNFPGELSDMKVYF